MAGSEWKLTEEGKSAEVADDQLQWSTWDDVFAGRRPGGNAAADNGASEDAAAGVLDDTLYRCRTRVRTLRKQCDRYPVSRLEDLAGCACDGSLSVS